jgi:hypothetical protein
MEGAMLPGEIAVLAFIIAAFAIFGITLAWISRHDGGDLAAPSQRPADHAAASRITSYQGADG